MFDLSPIQVILVLVIALMAFGPRRLPELARTIGRGVREARSVMNPLEGATERPPAPPPAPTAPSTHDAQTETSEDLAGMIVPGDSPPTSSAEDEPSSPAKAEP